mgnify:CR=1 FL=1
MAGTITSNGADAPNGGESLNLPGWARPIIVVGMMVAVMWAVEIVDLVPRTNFDSWGIQPREVRGVVGIVTMPFLHDGFGHLISNTIPFLILGSMIAVGGVARYFTVSAVITVVAGIGVWLLGPDGTVHIGASALVFGYLTYLLSRGFYERRISNIAVGLVVLFVYGGVLWGVLPRPGISWQGHLFGALGGVLAARVVHNDAVTSRKAAAT